LLSQCNTENTDPKGNLVALLAAALYVVCSAVLDWHQTGGSIE